jgi:IS1 family transposase
MRKLTNEQRATILTALVEGNSIASTCRMFGANKVTVLRLLADAGTLAADYHDLMVRNLGAERIQLDEVWSFVHSKNANVRPENHGAGHGDAWTWVSIDADTKLVINWLVGKRTGDCADEFVGDLADRLTNRVQITSDGFQAYRAAVAKAFGRDVDFATLIKYYGKPQDGQARYSPADVVAVESEAVCGSPIPSDISTSFIERQNLTVRMSMRRFTRLTNGFSKRLQNHKYAVALHYFHYNFIRKHQTIKTTPAVMADVTDKVWTMIDFVRLMETEERRLGGRISDYKPAASKRQD